MQEVVSRVGLGLEVFPNIWPKPFVCDLAPIVREKYTKRETAVVMYCNNASMKEIEEETGIKRAQVKKLFDRCAERDEYGNYYGFCALLPYMHLRKSEPRAESMAYLLTKKEKEIGKIILNLYFNDKNSGSYKHCSKKEAFHQMHLALNKKGYTDDMYPKTLKDKGYKSFCKFLSMVEKISSEAALSRATDSQRKLFFSTATENPVKPEPLRPYEKIEIDGHEVDAFYIMKTENPDGNPTEYFSDRCWLLAAIDVATRAIIGYRIIFDSAYDQYDVLKLIESIIKPMPHIQGVRHDGFPSQVLEDARWSLPNVIFLDNAMSHLARNVIQQTRELGVSFDFGPVETPTARPHIERFFRTLESTCISKLPSACGNKPDDPRRKKAKKEAIKYDITEDVMEKYIVLGMAEYNNTIFEDLGRTPNGLMRMAFNKGLVPAKMPFSLRDSFYIPIFKEVTVRGNRKEGRRPYIRFMNHRYTSDILADGYDLTNAKLIIQINPDDLTTVIAYLQNSGKCLGPLHMKTNKTVEKLSMKSIRKIIATNRELKYEEMTHENGIDTALARLEGVEKLAAGRKKKKKQTKKEKRAAETIRKDAGLGYLPASQIPEKEDLSLRAARDRINEQLEAYGYSADEMTEIVSDLI